MSISDFDSVLDMIAGGGVPSYTGKLIGPKQAMCISAFWACVNVLADDFATLPVLPFRWIDPGISREEARDHYLWPLLTEEANPRMSAHDFKKLLETWRNVWGNGFAEIEENGRGQVTALWPWHPDRTKVWLEDPNDVRSKVFYTYFPMDRGQKPITLGQDRVLHVKGTSLDGIVGLSTVQQFRQTLALREGKTEFSGRFYSNGARVGGILSSAGKVSTKSEQSIREAMEKYRGLSNSHRLMILEEGMKYEPMAMPLKDAQFIESMNFDDEEMARIHKVPQHRIGLLGRSTNNNIVQQSMEYVQYTLGPNAANWCGRMHCSLLSTRERASIFLQPDFNYLLQGDPAMRAALYTVLGSVGAFAPDDFRHLEGRNPLPNDLGKLPRVPLNTAPIGSDQAQGNKPETAPPVPPQKVDELKQALHGLLAQLEANPGSFTSLQ
jgi:HK97 family phage portal protein